VDLQLRGRSVPDGPVICAVTDGPDPGAAADAAADAGASLVDLGPVSADVVAAVRARQPGIFVCAAGAGAETADATWDPAVAARTGAGLLCRSAEAARASGTGRGCVLIAAGPAQVAPLAADGWAVLVDADGAGPDDVPALAVAAVSAWAGARVVRTRKVAAARQAIDMVESIRGTRPPRRATRGLA
jgi:hypothetical protein